MLMVSLMAIWSLARRKAVLGLGPNHHGAAPIIVMASTILIYGLVLGLRKGVGGDYDGYVGYYTSLSEGMALADVPYEWGFFQLIKLLRAFDLPPAALFLATCTIQMGFIASWMRRQAFLAPWYIYFFFTSLLVFESMSTIRQALAYGVILSALPSIQKRQWIFYSAMVLLATLFHKSALLFLPLYFLLDRDWLPNRVAQFVLLIIAYLEADYFKGRLFDVLPLLSTALGYGNNYAHFQDALIFETEVTGFSTGMLFLILVDGLIMWSSPMLKRLYGPFGFRIYYNIFLIGALMTPTALSANYIPFARLNFYFLAFKPVILAFAAHAWWAGAGRRPFWLLVLMSVLAAYLFFFIFAIAKQSAWCAPFKFVFQ